MSTPSQPTSGVASNNQPQFKSSPINPAWAEEVVASFGITGHLAKNVAAKICETATDVLNRKYPQPKLRKLVRSAVVQALK